MLKAKENLGTRMKSVQEFPLGRQSQSFLKAESQGLKSIYTTTRNKHSEQKKAPTQLTSSCNIKPNPHE
jgi:hypothetical protein